jgi:hypothetical protein
MIILRGESICNHFWTKPEYYSRYFLSRIPILVAWLDGLYSLLLDVYWSSRILGAPGLDRLKIGISSCYGASAGKGMLWRHLPMGGGGPYRGWTKAPYHGAMK